ncbi:22936_t:CDS:2, partial [Gigaspora rosea]
GVSKYHFIDKTPNEVWKASKKLKKFCVTQLFGLEHPLTHQVLSEQRIPKCDETYWHNKNIMNHLYNNFLCRYTISNQHTLAQLHSQGLLTLSPNNTSDKLWECFKNSYNMNKRGQDGCCPALGKPKITRVQLSKESLNQFMSFLLDKNVVTPSSYKVDAAT